MNAPTKVHLTQEGYDELQVELDKLLEKQPAAIERVTKAREHGDLSENSEFSVAITFTFLNLISNSSQLQINIVIGVLCAQAISYQLYVAFFDAFQSEFLAHHETCSK